MKTGIHPEYLECTVHCSCGNEFTTRSTVSQLRVELCSECHPFYTGKQKLVDTGGRVERFQRRLEKTKAAAEKAAAKPKATKSAAAPAKKAVAKKDVAKKAPAKKAAPKKAEVPAAEAPVAEAPAVEEPAASLEATPAGDE